MPRATKCRRICLEPERRIFRAEGSDQAAMIALDELESLRLCDLEGFSQEEAAAQMNVSRGTFQRILYAARQKVAEALCMGHGLVIGGGHFEIAAKGCSRGCRRCQRPAQFQPEEDTNENCGNQ